MTQKQLSKQKGLSLVELLVALALSSALMAGIIDIYLENKRNYVQNEEYARLQENGRFALGLLKREVIMAGFYAGLPEPSGMTASAISTDCVYSGNWALGLDASIELANDIATSGSVQTVSSTTFSSTCMNATELQAGSDVLAIKRTADTPTLENGNLNVGAASDKQWYLRLEEYGGTRSWEYIADGGSIPAGDATAGSKVDYWEFYAKILFIQSYSGSAGDNIPSLCIKSLENSAFTKNCFVEGIEDLQVEVGIDTNSDGYANQYVSAPTAAQLQNAVAVRLHLLVRSVNEIQGYTNNKTYALGGKTVTANDGYLRQVYSSTVLLRNDQLDI